MVIVKRMLLSALMVVAATRCSSPVAAFQHNSLPFFQKRHEYPAPGRAKCVPGGAVDCASRAIKSRAITRHVEPVVVPQRGFPSLAATTTWKHSTQTRLSSPVTADSRSIHVGDTKKEARGSDKVDKSNGSTTSMTTVAVSHMMTRSKAIASLASLSLVSFLGVSSSLLVPTALADEGGGDVGATDPGPSAEEVQQAPYTVGSDEFGVLFGDGPIGIKLGSNPLKASGVCRVYVTEV